MCDERQFVVYSEIINCWRADVYRGRFHWDRQDKNKSNEVKQMDWERKRREKKGIAVVGTECSIECDWRADAIDFSYSEHVFGFDWFWAEANIIVISVSVPVERTCRRTLLSYRAIK